MLALHFTYQVTGPFSSKRPDMDEHPGPPVNQMTISFPTVSFSDGKNQKNNSGSSVALPMGSRPAYDSPTSKPTSGSLAPSTANSVCEYTCVSYFYLSLLRCRQHRAIAITRDQLLLVLVMGGREPGRHTLGLVVQESRLLGLLLIDLQPRRGGVVKFQGLLLLPLLLKLHELLHMLHADWRAGRLVLYLGPRRRDGYGRGQEFEEAHGGLSR